VNLVVDAVSAGYGDTQVLWDVSLRVESGEIVALIGSNGAGKSTLLATISGLVKRRGGSITAGGAALHALTADAIVRAGVVQVPQGRRLFNALSVRENLLMGAYVRRDREISADLSRVLDLLPRLKARYDILGGRLSGGEQQQVAIARALMARPKLLLIDEMSLGLAPVMVDQQRDILTTINASGVSILMVEQDVQTALEFASRAYVLESGRIALAGVARDMLDDRQVRKAYLGV